jgi:hypothetical protein
LSAAVVSAPAAAALTDTEISELMISVTASALAAVPSAADVAAAKLGSALVSASSLARLGRLAPCLGFDVSIRAGPGAGVGALAPTGAALDAMRDQDDNVGTAAATVFPAGAVSLRLPHPQQVLASTAMTGSDDYGTKVEAIVKHILYLSREEDKAAARDRERRDAVRRAVGAWVLARAAALTPFSAAETAALTALASAAADRRCGPPPPARGKSLVFSQFGRMLDVVSAALRVNGVSHLALTGSARQRAALIQQFKTDPDVQVRTAIARFVHFFLSYFLHAC